MNSEATLNDASARTYWAFVSYSHSDAALARRIHEWLETYRIPEAFVGRATARCEKVPDRLFPVFFDRHELAGAAELTAEIRSALERSKNLVVVCSPKAAGSRYVRLEVAQFKALGREAQVFPVVVAGEPFARDAALECLPLEVRRKVLPDGTLLEAMAEPVCCDTRPQADGFHQAMLKLVAGITGIDLATLMDRDGKRRAKRNRSVVGGLVVMLAGVTALAGWAVLERNEKDRQIGLVEATSRKEIMQRQLAVANAVRADAEALEAQRQATLAREKAEEAERQRRRAEEEATVASAGRLAAESQLPNLQGPKEIQLAVAGYTTYQNVQTRQALMGTSARHQGSKQYLGEHRELLDASIALLGSSGWAYESPPFTPDGPAKRHRVRQLFGRGTAPFAQRSLSIDGDYWEVARSPVKALIYRAGLDDGKGHCTVEVANPLEPQSLRSIPIDECERINLRRSQNARFVAVGPRLVPRSGPTRQPGSLPALRVYATDTGLLVAATTPRDAEGGQELAMETRNAVAGLADDGKSALVREVGGRLWEVDVDTGRASPLDEVFNDAMGFNIVEGPIGIWWRTGKLAGDGVFQMLASRPGDAKTVVCQHKFAAILAPNEVLPTNVKILMAGTFTWSPTRATLAVLAADQGSVLRWCHAPTGREGLVRPKGIPSAVRLSDDDRYLAWAVDTDVRVLDLQSGREVLSDTVGFGMPIERIWFSPGSIHLMTLSSNGLAVRWALPTGHPGAPWHLLETAAKQSAGEDLPGDMGPRLRVSDSGRFLMAWNSNGATTIVDLLSGQSRSGDWAGDGLRQVALPSTHDARLSACVANRGCNGLAEAQMVSQRTPRGDGAIEFRLPRGRRLSVEPREATFIVSSTEGPQRLEAWHLPPPQGHPVLTQMFGAGPAKPGTIAALMVSKEAVESISSSRPLLPPGLMPLRADVEASMNGETLYATSVPVRAISSFRPSSMPPITLMILSDRGKVRRQFSPVSGLSFAMSDPAGLVAFQNTAQSVQVCSAADRPLATGARCQRIELGVDEPIATLALSPRGDLLATSSPRGVKIWSLKGDLLTAQPLQLPPSGPAEKAAQITALDFAPDSGTLYCLDDKGRITAWPVSAEQQLRRLKAMIGGAQVSPVPTRAAAR